MSLKSAEFAHCHKNTSQQCIPPTHCPSHFQAVCMWSDEQTVDWFTDKWKYNYMIWVFLSVKCIFSRLYSTAGTRYQSRFFDWYQFSTSTGWNSNHHRTQWTYEYTL